MNKMLFKPNRSQLSKHLATYIIAEKQSHDQKYSHRLSVHNVLPSTTVQQCHIQLKNRDALLK